MSLAEQGAPSLPSVGVSQQVPSSSVHWDEVFNIILGMVNQCWGAAQYSSQDQTFSFQKQVRFEPRSSPDLGSAPSPDPELWPQSSTPHRVPPSNQTVIYWYQCILCLSTIYNYAVDIVSLWCQIARASVTVVV